MIPPSRVGRVGRYLSHVIRPRETLSCVEVLRADVRAPMNERQVRAPSNFRACKKQTLYIALWEVKSVPKVPYIGLFFDHSPRFDYCTRAIQFAGGDQVVTAAW